MGKPINTTVLMLALDLIRQECRAKKISLGRSYVMTICNINNTML